MKADHSFLPCYQVCQETSPESSEGPIPSSPTRMSPLPANPLDLPDLDMESQPPVIHDIVASSPSDNEPQGVMSFVTNIDLGTPLDIPAVEIPLAEPEEPCFSPHTPEVPEVSGAAELALDTPADSEPIPPSHVEESHAFKVEDQVHIPTETLTAADAPSHVEADVSFIPDSSETWSQIPKSLGVTEHSDDEVCAPETAGAVKTEEEEDVEEKETPETETQIEGEDEEGMQLANRNI